jgi:hypothetical protein
MKQNLASLSLTAKLIQKTTEQETDRRTREAETEKKTRKQTIEFDRILGLA